MKTKLPVWIDETPTSMGFWYCKVPCILCGTKEDVWSFFYSRTEREICRGCATTHCGMGKRWEYAGGGSIVTLEKKA
jgi:hypothetical protein